MFENYLKIALRAMAKNKLYAAINILGLATGLCVFFFAFILADYEQTHDMQFKNAERIYTVGYRLKANSPTGLREASAAHSALGPLIKSELDEIEALARTHISSFVVSIGDKNFHQSIRFAEPAFLQIFDFSYLSGDTTALQSPDALVITEDVAIKWFGRTDVQGETVLVNGDLPMQITAVAKAAETNTHFNSLLVGSPFEVTGSFAALKPLRNYDLNGNWSNLSTGNHTYMLTRAPVNHSEFEHKLNDIFQRHYNVSDERSFIENVRLRHISELNTVLWAMSGLPIISSVQLLGFLILTIAIVNYTNLAVAQSMGRTREVGLRKTMGANKPQLMMQFLMESLATAFISSLLAVTLIEFITPIFNATTDKDMTIDYLAILPSLLLTTLLTGLLSGAYPSYLITRTRTLDALKDANNRGQKGGLFRASMIGVQFVLSIFMLALVMIVFLQNQKVKDSANIFPRDNVLVLNRIGTTEIFEKEELLKQQLLNVSGVQAVSFTSIPPFEQSNSSTSFYPEKGNANTEVVLNRLNIDHDFVTLLDIPIVAGRNFSTAISSDKRTDTNVRVINVLLNELAVRKLGYSSAADAIGQSIWGNTPDDRALDALEFKIVGVVADRNYRGLHNEVKPFLHSIEPFAKNYAMVRFNSGVNAQTISEIESTWKRIFPGYPMSYRFLDDYFNDIYQVYEVMNSVLAGFAFLALLLALIGLFGLAAFMARGRTKEIGIRKVMGASIPQIVRLLLWQFSKPVMWAIAVSLPLSIYASGMYLDFFAERISMQIPIIIFAGILAVVLACSVIAIHAYRVAKASPISALRYE